MGAVATDADHLTTLQPQLIGAPCSNAAQYCDISMGRDAHPTLKVIASKTINISVGDSNWSIILIISVLVKHLHTSFIEIGNCVMKFK